MRLVDTSAWVEWLIASPTGKSIAAAIPVREEWLVPTIIQLELAKWLTREAGEDKADQVVAFTQMCHVVPLDTKIALAAAELCRQHKLATADAIVYATALEHGADLLTCDAHFDGLPGVTFVGEEITIMSDAENNEDNERTTATGLFNYAVSYQKSAEALARTEIKGVTHPDSPIEFLYVHSIELFLKAYLRLNFDVSKIRSISHNFNKLVAESVKQGMTISDGDGKILALIHEHKMNLGTRYIITGPRFNYPTTESLGEVSYHLQASIKKQFTTVDLRVR